MKNKYIKTFESYKSEISTLTLYHGTSKDRAETIIENGWSPRPKFIGSNGGNGNYLYLSSEIEDAQWFSNEMGCDTVIKISNIPLSYLRPDPEDEAGYSMDDLLKRIANETGSPSKFILTTPLPPSSFSIVFANDTY